MPDQPRGIDVSNWQGQPDWAAVATSGVQFAIVKASEGVGYVDPTLAHNWEGMKASGLARGAYHFARPSVNDATAEAEFFANHVEAVGLDAGDLLVLDIEDPDFNGNAGPWCLQWLRHVEERMGFSPLVYTGPWYIDSRGLSLYSELGKYGLWLAAYQPIMPSAKAPWLDILIWQNSDKGQVPGVAGNCDTDVASVPIEVLRAYGKPGSAPVPVVDPVAPVPDEKAALISQLGYARGDVADALQSAIDSAQAAVNTLRTIGR